MALPFSLSVIVERNDQPPPAGSPPRAFSPMVFLARVDGPVLIRPAADVLQNLYPGRYRIHATSVAPGLYVESIKLGEIEAYGRQVDIWDGSLPIRITLRRGAPVVRGTVEAGEGRCSPATHYRARGLPRRNLSPPAPAARSR